MTCKLCHGDGWRNVPILCVHGQHGMDVKECYCELGKKVGIMGMI